MMDEPTYSRALSHCLSLSLSCALALSMALASKDAPRC